MNCRAACRIAVSESTVQTSRGSYFAILEREEAGRGSGGGAGITGLTPSLQGLPYWNNGPLNTKLHQHSAAVLQVATTAQQQQLSRHVANRTGRQDMYNSAKSNHVFCLKNQNPLKFLNKISPLNLFEKICLDF